jgi:hypothetical protein
MRPILFIGYQAFVLKDTAHLQTVLKALGEAERVKNARDADGNLVRIDGKFCYQVEPAEHQEEARVEMVADKRVFPADWKPAIEPEIVEESEEVEIDLTDGRTRRRPRRKALPAAASPAIDARKEFTRLREAVNQPTQLLLGQGGAA